MVKNFENTGRGQILVEKVRKNIISDYGVVNINKRNFFKSRSHKILDLVEKPSISKTPSNFRIVGRYIVPYEILKSLESTKPDRNKEIQLTDAIKMQVKSGTHEFEAFLSNSKIFDCGSIKDF